MKKRIPVRFKTYKHQFVTKGNQLIVKHLIVLEYSDGTLGFTDFHRYALSHKTRMENIGSDNRVKLGFIIQLLNYAFFDRHICCLNEITVDIIKDFLNAYAGSTLPNDGEYAKRAKSTYDACCSTILDFFQNYLMYNKGALPFEEDDMFTYESYRDKNGRCFQRKVPKFNIYYNTDTKPIFRDMPNAVFEILFDHITVYHPEMLGLVLLSAFGGLRPSEACNVKREGAPDGSGIRITTVNGIVRSVEIDISRERPMRSDLVSVGKIKKERKVTVPKCFLQAFMSAYSTYLDYLEMQPYEEEYAPFSVNSRGKAITYELYYKMFRSMVKDELVPILLSSEDPTVVNFGHALLENNISPHIFRHWFTVQLVLSGINDPIVIANYRGDSSVQSAVTYLNNKSELQRAFKEVNEEQFEFMKWASEKIFL